MPMLELLDRFEGWPILEAIERCVDPDLIEQQREGVPHIDFEILEAFRGLMFEGRLAATGRRGSRGSVVVNVPPSHWQDAKAAVNESLLQTLRPRATYFDVKVFPIVQAPNAVELLAGMSLAEVFRDYVDSDPEIAAREKEFARRGSTPRLDEYEGRTERHMRTAWRVDWADLKLDFYLKRSEMAELLWETPEEHQPAERPLVARFYGLMELLRTGRIATTGVPRLPNLTSEVPRTVWFDYHYAIDVQFGDVLGPNEADKHELARLHINHWAGVILKKPDAEVDARQPTRDNLQIASPPRVAIQSASKKGRRKSRSAADAYQVCLDLLIGEMSKSLGRKIRTKAFWSDKARKKLGRGYSARAFDRAWNRAIEDTGALVWRRPGAPRKNPHT